ncbi:hypothetical protein PO181_06985 [Leuconostoc suionicum]|uniref:hypothetical protein n=1 Tax=Leuconostoc suionicum TaxID=1511761 RepID=UPI00233E9631|nr:hypothetical protein [Leuconostoc suionicum]MDC2816726.1 hypothetical protein [Leuconostoc suionicum]
MSTVLQVIILLIGAALIRAAKKPNPHQKYQRYIGIFLLIFGIIIFVIHLLK